MQLTQSTERARVKRNDEDVGVFIKRNGTQKEGNISKLKLCSFKLFLKYMQIMIGALFA